MNRQSNRPGNLKEWLALRIKLNYSQRNVGAKVEPHTPSILIVFPTQMPQYLRLVWDCGVCSLSYAECLLNSEKSTAMIGCFNTRYFAFNFNRHLPHVQVVTRDCGLR